MAVWGLRSCSPCSPHRPPPSSSPRRRRRGGITDGMAAAHAGMPAGAGTRAGAGAIPAGGIIVAAGDHPWWRCRPRWSFARRPWWWRHDRPRPAAPTAGRARPRAAGGICPAVGLLPRAAWAGLVRLPSYQMPLSAVACPPQAVVGPPAGTAVSRRPTAVSRRGCPSPIAVASCADRPQPPARGPAGCRRGRAPDCRRKSRSLRRKRTR